MQQAVRKRLKATRKPATDTKRLEGDLRKVEARLERIADAIERTGLTDTLAKRMALHEQERKALKGEIATAGQHKAPALPDIIPSLVKRYRGLVEGIARLGSDPAVTLEDVEKARGVLRSLFGRIPVSPDGGVLVATVSTTTVGLVENKAMINSQFRCNVLPVPGLRIPKNLCCQQ